MKKLATAYRIAVLVAVGFLGSRAVLAVWPQDPVLSIATACAFASFFLSECEDWTRA